MKLQLAIKFLHRVRIHGGEFDSSARAMNRAEGSDSLQADLRKFRGSTIERKTMSTKTTIKRIALVSVAALGLGVLTVTPSSAAVQLDSITVSASSTTQNTTETLTATAVSVTVALASVATETMTVTATIKTGPAYVAPKLVFVESTTAATTGTGTSEIKISGRTASVSQASAKYSLYLDAPSVAGTYVIALTPTGHVNAVAKEVTIVVSPRVYTAAQNSALSKAFMVSTQADEYAGVDKANGYAAYWKSLGNSQQQVLDTFTAIACGTVNPTIAAAQAGQGCAMDTLTALVGTSNANQMKNVSNGTVVASIYAYQSNASTVSANTAVAYPMTATVTGPAEVAVGSVYSTAVFGASATEGDYGYTYLEKHVFVRSTGKTGTATITLSIHGTVFATKQITFTGTTTKYVGGTQVFSTLPVGSTNSVAITGADADGNATGSATVYAVSSDTSVATVGTAGTTSVSTVAVLGVKAGTATIKLCDTASCTSATKTGEFKVTVGAVTADKVVVALTPDAPTPGEKVTVTLTATNAGLPIGNGTYSLLSSTGLTTSLTVTGSTLPTNDSVTVVDGKATYIFYAPVGSGTLTVSGTEGTATTSTTKAAITASASIVNAGLDAATDAANEAAQAASDATDAALAAADAADAATTKAQEAVDAVATLSAQVSKMITALKAQITTLTNLVIKIQKKVKA